MVLKFRKSFRKEFFRTKYLVAIVLVFLFVPRVLYASDLKTQSDSSSGFEKNNFENDIEAKNIAEDSVFKDGSNVIYRFMDKNEYMFAPMSGAAAGMIRCGYRCAALGGIAGIIDEFLVYSGFTDKRYLTWGILGITAGHVINNRRASHVSDIAGLVVGILLPTGKLNDHKELIAPVASIIAGNSIGGVSGFIGEGAGVFDEILLNNGIADKHYLTFCTVGVAAANLLEFGFNPAVINAIGAVLGLIAAGYEERISADLLAPIEMTNSLYETYRKFIPKDQINNHIERHILSLVGSQFLTQFLSLKTRRYQQDLVHHFERLNNPNGPAWSNLKSGMVNFVIFIFPYAIGQMFSNNIDHYFGKKLHVALEERVKEELFSGETALRLSHDKDNMVLIDNLKEDVSTVVDSGSWLVTSAISTSIGGIYGVGMIVVYSPNVFIYSALYNKAQTSVASYLADQRRAYGKKIREIDSKLVTTIKHDAEHIRTIMEQDGIEVTKEKILQFSSDLRELEGAQRLWSMANSLWWSVLGTADYVIDYFLIAREIHHGRIPFESRGDVQAANWQASSLLSWSGHQAQMISDIEESLDRVIILEGKIHALPDDLDQINRIVKQGDQLIFQDLEVGIGNRVLVTIKDLKLDMGKVYAITGETGCGKTSLLSKIKGIKENGVFGKGYICYPEINKNKGAKEKTPKIVMLSQQDYFPLDSSLYDIISYPDKIPDDPILDEEKRQKISLLLKEIGLHTFGTDDIESIENIDGSRGSANSVNIDDMVGEQEIEKGYVQKKGAEREKDKKNDEMLSLNSKLDLDSKKDWHTRLSGGEKKKVKIVSAIVKNPNILILDEIFTGLDLSSIITIQQMLKKYLPDTMILSVDHRAQNNNHNNFYNNEIHFHDKRIIFRKMNDG